jgi:uncharacterized membrane protein YkoI
MARRVLSARFFGLVLSAAATVLPAVPSRAAQGCLSASEARAAAASGKVVPLSQLLGEIGAAAGGQVLPTPQLCSVGGRYVYLVNVLSSRNQVTRLTIDASSGAILGH